MREPARPPPPVRLVVAPTPLTASDRTVLDVPEGATVAELVERHAARWRFALVVYVEGERVARDRWGEVVPAAGQVVAIRALAAGGGGSGGGSKALRIVATIAAIVLTIVTAGAAAPTVAAALGVGEAVAFALVAATVNIASQLAISALIPPPRPEDAALPDGRGTHLLSAARNSARPFSVVPRALGTRRYAPPLAAMPTLDLQAGRYFLTQAFDFGTGPCDLSDLRIGEDPLLGEDDEIAWAGEIELTGRYKGRLELRRGHAGDEPVTLLTEDAEEERVGLELRGGEAGVASSRSPVVRRTKRDATEISVDLVWPTGLIFRKDDGGVKTWRSKVSIAYRSAGADEDAPWTDAPGSPIVKSARSEKPLARSTRWSVPAGQYDVKVTRLTPRAGDRGISDLVQWHILRSHRAADMLPPGHCYAVLRLRGTGQVNGAIDDLSALVTSRIPHWDPDAGEWVERAGGNPAACFRAVLTAPDNHLAVAEADVAERIDLARLEEWSEWCEERGYSYDRVLDDESTVHRRLTEICSAGRAALTMRGGKYSVVWDAEPPAVVQTLSPRNVTGFRGRRVFGPEVHALRVRFANPALDWGWDERVVYDDGYSERGEEPGTVAATAFEAMDFPGVTTPSQVWREARYHLAVARLRVETFELDVDPEHLVCERGDGVRVVHDVPGFGVGAARITGLVLDGDGDVTHLEVDELLEMEAGKLYAARVRRRDLSTVLLNVATVAGENDSLALEAAHVLADPPIAVGDLVLFGERTKESVEMLVRGIQPGPDLSAKLLLVPVAPAVYDADTAQRPDWAEDEEEEEGGDAPLWVPSSPGAPVVDAIPPATEAVEVATGIWRATTTYDTAIKPPVVPLTVPVSPPKKRARRRRRRRRRRR